MDPNHPLRALLSDLLGIPVRGIVQLSFNRPGHPSDDVFYAVYAGHVVKPEDQCKLLHELGTFDRNMFVKTFLVRGSYNLDAPMPEGQEEVVIRKCASVSRKRWIVVCAP